MPGSMTRCLVLDEVFLLLNLGAPLPSTRRRFSAILGKETITSSLLMLLSPSTRRIAIFSAVHQVGSDFQLGSEGYTSVFGGKFGSTSSLPLDLVLLGPETGHFSKHAPSVWSLLLHFLPPGAATFKASFHSCMPTTLNATHKTLRCCLPLPRQFLM